MMKAQQLALVVLACIACTISLVAGQDCTETTLSSVFYSGTVGPTSDGASDTLACTLPYSGTANFDCAESQFTYTGGCEKTFQVGAKSITFVISSKAQPNATADCVARGGQLVALETAAERDAVAAEQAALAPDNGDSWIGLESVNQTATTIRADYRWLTTGLVPDEGVSIWAADEPNNFDETEGICVEQRASPNWNDLACTERRLFFCEPVNTAPPYGHAGAHHKFFHLEPPHYYGDRPEHDYYGQEPPSYGGSDYYYNDNNPHYGQEPPHGHYGHEHPHNGHGHHHGGW